MNNNEKTTEDVFMYALDTIRWRAILQTHLVFERGNWSMQLYAYSIHNHCIKLVLMICCHHRTIVHSLQNISAIAYIYLCLTCVCVCVCAVNALKKARISVVNVADLIASFIQLLVLLLLLGQTLSLSHSFEQFTLWCDVYLCVKCFARYTVCVCVYL